MTRVARSACLLLTSLVLGVGPAAAQSAVQESPAAVDLSYNLLSKSESSSLGFHLGYWQVWRESETASLRWLGELDVTKFEFASVTAVQGGVRYVMKLQNQPRLRPFVQGIVGFEHCCGSTDLAISPGGGIFYAYSDRFDIIAQVDFRHVRYDGFSDTHQRYSVGISLPVGAR